MVGFVMVVYKVVSEWAMVAVVRRFYRRSPSTLALAVSRHPRYPADNTSPTLPEKDAGGTRNSVRHRQDAGKHLELMDKARPTTLPYMDAIETYFHILLLFCRQMADADLSKIAIEAKVAPYVIRGLRSHLTLRTYVSVLNRADIDTIQKAKTAVTSYAQLHPPQEQTLQSYEATVSIHSL